MADFDIQSARQAGYSDDEIASHLASTRKFDLEGAKKAGYSPAEIVEHLSGSPKKEVIPGTEKLGTPPNMSVAPSVKTPELMSDEQKQQATSSSGGIGYMNPRTGTQHVQQIAPVPMLDDPTQGISKIGQGLTAASSAITAPSQAAISRGASLEDTQTRRNTAARGVSDVVRGGLQASAPLLPGAAISAPLKLATGMAAGSIAQPAVQGATSAMGASPEVSQAFGDVASVIAGGKAAEKVPARFSDLPPKIKLWADEKTAVPDPIKAVVQAQRPRNNQLGYEEAMKTAKPLIEQASVKTGVPVTDSESYIHNIKAAKQATWDKVKQLTGDQGDELFDTNSIADKAQQAIIGSTKKEDLANVQPALDKFNAWRGNMPRSALEQELLKSNAAVAAFEASLPALKHGDLLRHPEISGEVAKGDAIRDLLYQDMERPGDGADLRELKRRYGTLIDAELTAQRRKIVADRQAPNSLTEQLSKVRAAGHGVRGAAKIASGLATGHAGLAVSGLSDIATAGVEPKAAAWIKEQNTTNGLLRRAFQQPSQPLSDINIPIKSNAVDPNSGVIYKPKPFRPFSTVPGSENSKFDPLGRVSQGPQGPGMFDPKPDPFGMNTTGKIVGDASDPQLDPLGVNNKGNAFTAGMPQKYNLDIDPTSPSRNVLGMNLGTSAKEFDPNSGIKLPTQVSPRNILNNPPTPNEALGLNEGAKSTQSMGGSLPTSQQVHTNVAQKSVLPGRIKLSPDQPVVNRSGQPIDPATGRFLSKEGNAKNSASIFKSEPATYTELFDEALKNAEEDQRNKLMRPWRGVTAPKFARGGITPSCLGI